MLLFLLIHDMRRRDSGGIVKTSTGSSPEDISNSEINQEKQICRIDISGLPQQYQLQELRSIEKDLATELQVATVYTNQIEALISQLQGIKERLQDAQSIHNDALHEAVLSHESHAQDTSRQCINSLRQLAHIFREEMNVATADHDRLRRTILIEESASKGCHVEKMNLYEQNLERKLQEIERYWEDRNCITNLLAEDSMRAATQATKGNLHESTAHTGETMLQILEDADAHTKLVQKNQAKIEELKSKVEKWEKALAIDAFKWRKELDSATDIKREALESYRKIQHNLEDGRKRHQEALRCVAESR